MIISNELTKVLSKKIISFVEELETIPWFINVGNTLNSEEVKQLCSWGEAWENLQNETWINASFHNHIDNMNPLWDIAYEKALQTVSKSIYCHEFEEGISVADAVAYDVAAAAVEMANISTHTFFTDLMKWYRLGHFPCGWEGKYPEGKLIVY